MSHPANTDPGNIHPRRSANPFAKCPKAKRDDVQLLLRAAWDQGAWIEKGKGGHYKVYAADGTRIIVVPAMPSDHHALRNVRSLLRNAGINLKRK
jgi:predicted RNA binding protein YcfA (HicA-like mRNA interferase family)